MQKCGQDQIKKGSSLGGGVGWGGGLLTENNTGSPLDTFLTSYSILLFCFNGEDVGAIHLLT